MIICVIPSDVPSAQAERKGKNKGKKGKKKEDKKKEEMTASVSAVITDHSDPLPSSTSTVLTNADETVCFYVGCDTKWMLDSGCTHHITSDKNDFTTYRQLSTPEKAWFADHKSYTTYIGIGTVKGTTRVRGRTKSVQLDNVLHSPGIGSRFFSILKVGQKGFLTTFSGHNAAIMKDDEPFMEAKVHGNHYWATISPSSISVSMIAARVPIEILHARLGHLSWSSLQKLSQNIDLAHKRVLSTCEGCLLGKSTRRKFPVSTHRQTEPFGLVHMDLAGPMRTRSIQGHFYHFIIVDDYTHYKWIYFLTTKEQTFARFREFHAFISTHYGGTLRAARSDRGGEFCSTEFTNYMAEKRMHHQLTAPQTPQQNGVTECANWTVAEAARAMLQSAGMSPGFWEFAVATAVHVRNRAPSWVTGYISPHKHLLKSSPDLSYLQTLSCGIHCHIRLS